MDDPSCISFSENIDESPNRKISGLTGAVVDKLINNPTGIDGSENSGQGGTTSSMSGN